MCALILRTCPPSNVLGLRFKDNGVCKASHGSQPCEACKPCETCKPCPPCKGQQDADYKPDDYDDEEYF